MKQSFGDTDIDYFTAAQGAKIQWVTEVTNIKLRALEIPDLRKEDPRNDGYLFPTDLTHFIFN